MKLKTFFTKTKLFFLVVFILLLALFLNRFEITNLEFTGDLVYLDLDSTRLTGLIFLKNKNLFILDKNEFEKNLLYQNPEIDIIEISPKSSSLIQINIKNKDICCVVSDQNTNKFLISHNGKVYKKLQREKNYPHEISLNQQIDLNSEISIESLKKIVEIENLLLSKDVEITQINIENDKIEFKLISGGILVLDSNTNTKNFIERMTNMLNYFKQKNLTFNKMDFRFGNVVVE